MPDFIEGKLKIIRVTTTEEYYVKMVDDERTEINGWNIDQVINDWFYDHPLDSYHATRDTHRIGNSKKMVHFKILNRG